MVRRKVFKTIVVLALLGALIFFSEPLGVKSFAIKLTRPLFRSAMWVNGLGLNQGEISLREENERLKANLFELEQLRVENATLKKALSFKETSKLSLKGAKVIFYSQESGKEFLIIDQGKETGIKAGDLVIDAEQAFIGTVKEAGDGFSKVGVAANPGETFEIEVESLPGSSLRQLRSYPAESGIAEELLPGLKIRALAKGLGARAFSIELLPLDIVLRKGDFAGLVNKDKFLLLAEIYGEKITSGSVFKEARALLIARPELARQVFIINSRQ